MLVNKETRLKRRLNVELLLFHLLLQVAVLQKVVAHVAVLADAQTADLHHDVHATGVVELVKVGILVQLTVLLDAVAHLSVTRQNDRHLQDAIDGDENMPHDVPGRILLENADKRLNHVLLRNVPNLWFTTRHGRTCSALPPLMALHSAKRASLKRIGLSFRLTMPTKWGMKP